MCYSTSVQALTSDIENAKDKDDSFEKNNTFEKEDSLQTKLLHKVLEHFVFSNTIYFVSLNFYYKHHTFPLIYISLPIRPPIFSV